MRPTREVLLDAAAEVMRERGLARTTTKEIARAAGYSEATLYKNFADKEDLFVAVLAERVPGDLAALLSGLPARVGRDPVAEVLADVARTALTFYSHTFPIAASVFSEPRLLAAHRSALAGRGAGPQVVVERVARYLAGERTRLRPGTDPRAAAALLLGACLQHAFLTHYAGTTEAGDPEALVRTLLAGIAPGPSGAR